MKADTYLSHCYAIPETPSVLPLADEAFASVWKESEGVAAREFLAEIVGRDIASFPLRQEETLRIFFAKTLGGRLPVIVTGNRNDFLRVEALLNGREDLADFPVTVNAFTMQAQAKNIRNHRVILLGLAPYSNVPANLLGLDEEEWIERSCRLRFAHECAHYERAACGLWQFQRSSAAVVFWIRAEYGPLHRPAFLLLPERTSLGTGGGIPRCRCDTRFSGRQNRTVPDRKQEKDGNEGIAVLCKNTAVR